MTHVCAYLLINRFLALRAAANYKQALSVIIEPLVHFPLSQVCHTGTSYTTFDEVFNLLLYDYVLDGDRLLLETAIRLSERKWRMIKSFPKW